MHACAGQYEQDCQQYCPAILLSYHCCNNLLTEVAADMSTIVNMDVLLIQISLFQQPQTTFHIASSLLNNIVETRMTNMLGPTILLTHDN